MATEKRLIYAEDAMKWIRESKVPETGAFTKGINKGLNIALSTLGNNEVLPTADAMEVVHGQWVKYEDDRFNGYYADGRIRYRKVRTYYCDKCGYGTVVKSNYCSNCGAKTEGERNV